MNQKGFSLIEVLIAITILAVVGIIISTILTRSFQVGTQTENISKVKENGDRALDLMAETIRNSEAVICYGSQIESRKTEIVVRDLSGKYIKFKFNEPITNNGTKVVQNGYITKQQLDPIALSDPSNPSDFCDNTYAVQAPELITTYDKATGISVSEGEFKKLEGNLANKDTVQISFYANPTLTKYVVSPSVDPRATKMQTTVQIR